MKIKLRFSFVFLSLLSFVFIVNMFFITRAHAVIMFPFFNITVNEHTVGGDGNFNFHIIANTPPNPITNFTKDFNIQTVSNSGTNITSVFAGNGEVFYITQDSVSGWQAPSVTCSSTDPSIIFTPINGGVSMNDAPFTSITCDFTNTASVVGDSNVLFIPGLEASRLYKQKTILGLPVEDQLWEPNTNSDVEDLYLNTDGTSKNPNIYTRDIVKETNSPISFGFLGQNIYKSFSTMMDKLVSDGKINEWKSYAYDWRQDIQDIVDNGTKYQNENISLISTLQSLVSSSKSGKVTIVAHSNGGLIAKAFLKKLQDDKIAGRNNLIDNIDVLILVAVPEIGTASAVPAIMHGYDQSILGGWIMDEVHARELGRNMVSAFGLLPSKEYINRVSASPVTFVDTLIPSNVTTKMVQAFGSAVSSYAEFKDFLFGNEGRVNPTSLQTNLPIILSQNLFSKAENLHNNIDFFTPPSGLRVIEVAGWGLDTVASFEYYPICETSDSLNCKFILDERPRFTSDGDKTVVVPSAQYMGVNGNAEKYWVDLLRYNRFFYFNINREHKDILEVSQLNNLIQSTIEKKDIIFDTVLKNIEPIDTLNRFRISVHSPVTLDAYDLNGNHTGKICPSNSDFCYKHEDIQNSSYLEFGEGKYINLPEDQMSKVKLQGTSSGTFTYDSEKVLSNGASTISSFMDIPVTSQTKAEVTINPSTQVPQLALDVNGDGVVDFVLAPSATFDPVMYLQIMKKIIESFGISKHQKNALIEKISDILEEIQEGNINEAKQEIKEFRKDLTEYFKKDDRDKQDKEKRDKNKQEKDRDKDREYNGEEKQLTSTEIQTLLVMLGKLLVNLK